MFAKVGIGSSSVCVNRNVVLVFKYRLICSWFYCLVLINSPPIGPTNAVFHPFTTSQSFLSSLYCSIPNMSTCVQEMWMKLFKWNASSSKKCVRALNIRTDWRLHLLYLLLLLLILGLGNITSSVGWLTDFNGNNFWKNPKMRKPDTHPSELWFMMRCENITKCIC